MLTKRIDFDDGNWWEIKTVVTRGMRKRIEASLVGKVDLSSNGIAVDIRDAEAVSTAVMANPSNAIVAVSNQEDTYLLEGTAAWSWDMKINVKNFDELPDRYVSVVLERLKELYEPLDQEAQKKLESAAYDMVNGIGTANRDVIDAAILKATTWSWPDYLETPDVVVQATILLHGIQPDENIRGMGPAIGEWKRDHGEEDIEASLEMEVLDG